MCHRVAPVLLFLLYSKIASDKEKPSRRSKSGSAIFPGQKGRLFDRLESSY